MNRTESNHSNFRDPIGLAWRMLRGASRESVGPLLQAACEVLAKPIDKIAARWESFDARDDDSPQLLIVGLPRTGTTVISQVLARCLQVSYFSNVSAAFPSAPIWATRRFVGSFDRPLNSTRNFYGTTAGIRGISDGFHIWNRWFGTNRYRIDCIPDDDQVADLQAFFGAWNGVFGMPLLNKNNRNVDCVELLASYLPNAHFVVVDRSPEMTVQSLLLARKFVQGTENAGWGLFSNQFEAEPDPITAICRQVAFGHHRMQEQLSRISPDRIVRFSYEEFCSSPQDVIRPILESVDGVKLRNDQPMAALPQLRATTEIRVSSEDWERIKGQLIEARRAFEAKSRTPTDVSRNATSIE